MKPKWVDPMMVVRDCIQLIQLLYVDYNNCDNCGNCGNCNKFRELLISINTFPDTFTTIIINNNKKIIAKLNTPKIINININNQISLFNKNQLELLSLYCDHFNNNNNNNNNIINQNGLFILNMINNNFIQPCLTHSIDIHIGESEIPFLDFFKLEL